MTPIHRAMVLLMAALPPAIWGSTYLVTTELLPPDKPLMAAVLRILPVGLVITLMTRYRPDRSQWGKLLVVSLLCMSLLHWPLFVAAYRLPGGLAALLVASQPLLIMIMGWLLFGTRTPLHVAIGVFIGLGGVAMILIAPSRLAWDTVGIAAALLAACSMALGILLVKRWQLAIPTLAFTGWQLLLGGLILLPFALAFELPFQQLETNHLGGYFYLAVIGTLLPYFLWYRALRHLEPVLITAFLFFSPISAMLLGYLVLDQALTLPQIAGAIAVFAGILISHYQPGHRRRTGPSERPNSPSNNNFYKEPSE